MHPVLVCCTQILLTWEFPHLTPHFVDEAMTIVCFDYVFRKIRKAMSSSDFKKAARMPWRTLKGVKTLGGGSGDGVVVLD